MPHIIKEALAATLAVATPGSSQVCAADTTTAAVLQPGCFSIAALLKLQPEFARVAAMYVAAAAAETFFTPVRMALAGCEIAPSMLHRIQTSFQASK